MSRPTERGIHAVAQASGRAQSPVMAYGAPRRSYLPVPLTSFIGREREASEVEQLVERQRLVTLSGPPGVGKTRLAIRVADELCDHFADGAWLVELASLGESALVPSVVAGALGLQVGSAGEPTQALLELLKSWHLLLVLDNCEHLLDACANLADLVLRSSPEVHLLITSREPLGLAGEVVWRVPSMTLPEGPDRASPAEPNRRRRSRRAIGDVLTSEAGRLFVDRARAVRPGLELSDDAGPSVAAICRQLDGIPLAIELAAARVTALSPREIASRLDDRFSLLSRGSRAAPPQQRTLRGLIDWSHQLLSEPERTLFRRLALFAGGWTLEAAETVCGGEATCDSRPDILDLLAQLVDKSLVVAEPSGNAMRYRFLATIRQYATERLNESGELVSMRDGHLAWYLDLAERADVELQGSRQVDWLSLLEAEHDNLRAAQAWARENGDAEAGLRLATGLWRFWRAHGHLVEGHRWFADVLTSAGTAAPVGLRGAALLRAGRIALDLGEVNDARSMLDEAVSIGRELGDHPIGAGALTQRGHLARLEGSHDEAKALYEESFHIRSRLGDQLGLAWSLGGLAHVARAEGDSDRARSHYERSLAIHREVGHHWEAALMLWYLGELAYDQQAYADAGARYRESLTIWHELSDPQGTAASLEGIATVDAATGHAERAVHLAGAAASVRASFSVSLSLADPDRLERRLGPARQALGDARTEELTLQGRATALDDAIAYALEPSEAVRVVDEGADAGTSALTRRELDVARLLAAGFTNRQIADELVLSGRTAEWHVRNILRKLGLTSRAQLAVWAYEHDST